MFLISCLLVFTFVYWYCALLAELVLTSSEERALPAPVRAGVAFLFSTMYFGAAWQLMSINQAWVMGLLLISMYVVTRAPANWRTEWKGIVHNFVRRNGMGFGACFAGAIVLFAPLLLANKFGPFTEGGGDVSIYADATQYLTEHQLTLYGEPSQTTDQAIANLKRTLRVTLDRGLLSQEAEKRYLAADRSLINPPSTDNAVYRMVLRESVAPFLLTPYGQFYFLAGSTNYHVYYGIQAFIYAVLLASAWSIFRRFRLRVALAYTGLAAGSHGLVSVFYNMYSAQAISLLVTALLLALLPSIRLFSWSGLRTYIIPTAYIWITYVHFLSLIVPLLALAGLRRIWTTAHVPVHPTRRKPLGRSSPELLRFVAIGTFTCLVALLIVTGAQKSILLALNLTIGAWSGGNNNVYLGVRIEPFSLQWLSFLFGFISQQHLQPFALEVRWVLWTIYVGVAFAVSSFLFGIAAIARMLFSPSFDKHPEWKSYCVVYAILLITVAAHIYVTQTYVYTQAKGAQNVVLLLYAVLVMPFGLGIGMLKRDRTLHLLTSALSVTLLLLATTLLVPRAVYAYKISRSMDRSTILEPSFFAEAKKIREQDANPFVLFEPRKSGDLYVSIQPFSGARLASTRHLAMTQLNFETGTPVGKRIDASHLIRAADIPHLWTLSARKGEAAVLDNWIAERVDAGKHVATYLFADDYEQNFGPRPRRDDGGDTGMFSYVRNGSAMVYLPAGEPMTMEITLAPRDIPAFDRARMEVADRLKKDEFGDAVMKSADGFITLTRYFAKREVPTMTLIARYSGEYWLNVRVDGKELATASPVPGAAGSATVSGVLRKDLSGKITIEASWAGIAAPQKEDWIGVFPVGGNDQSRLEFGFLEGRKEGSLTFTLAARTADADFEVRLYKPGSWNAVAISRVKAADAPSR